MSKLKHFGYQKNHFTIPTDFNDDSNVEISYSDIPNICPNCGMTISPITVSATSKDNNVRLAIIAVLLKCPNKECELFFMKNYQQLDKGTRTKLIDDMKFPDVITDIPEDIKNIFPNFYSIYQQTIKAHNVGLHDVAGMGLRKSLEFLIKDFVKMLNKNNTEIINKIDNPTTTLNYVIKTYLSDFTDIQSLATNSAWFGNDSTHYSKRFPEKDFDDNIQLLQYIVFLIQTKLATNIAEKFIKNHSN